MATYTITKEIRSVAYFPLPLTLGDFTFQTLGGRDTGRAHVTVQLEADEFQPALADADDRLRTVLDALTATALIAASTYAGSVLVERAGSSIIWCQLWDEQPDVVTIAESLTHILAGFDAALEGVQEEKELRSAAHHYRESLLYGSALVSTIHLLRALEALAGKETYSPSCPSCGEETTCKACGKIVTYSRTSHPELEHLLGTPTFKYFYKNPGARNRLMHGGWVEQTDLAKYLPILRKTVEGELRTALGLNAKAWIERARGPVAYRSYPIWLDTGGSRVSLDQLLDIHRTNGLSHSSQPRMLTQEEVDPLRGEY